MSIISFLELSIKDTILPQIIPIPKVQPKQLNINKIKSKIPPKVSNPDLLRFSQVRISAISFETTTTFSLKQFRYKYSCGHWVKFNNYLNWPKTAAISKIQTLQTMNKLHQEMRLPIQRIANQVL